MAEGHLRWPCDTKKVVAAAQVHEGILLGRAKTRILTEIRTRVRLDKDLEIKLQNRRGRVEKPASLG
jgi:hypothetical protein